jgi:hypothetical protein
VIIGCGIFLFAALVVVMMGATVSSMRPVEPAPVASALPDGDLRAAKITNLGGSGCSQQIFDNQTGRVVPSRQPCEATAYDSPETTRRLDALSKSFSGR